MKIYELMISLIEKGKVTDHTVLNYLMLKSIKGDNKVVNKKTGATIEQHQYQISLRKLSEKTCLSFKQTRIAISNLVKIGAINYKTVEGQCLFTINYVLNENVEGTANPLCSKEFDSFGAQQNQKRAQQDEKNGTEKGTVNSLNNSELQDFGAHIWAQQDEKNGTTYINNNLINKELLKMEGMSTDISTGQKIENSSVENQFYSDSDFGCETPTTSTPIVEYEEKKENGYLFNEKEIIKKEMKKLYSFQLLGLIDSTFPLNVDEKTTENRNTYYNYYSNQLETVYNNEVNNANSIEMLNSLYLSFEAMICTATKKLVDVQTKRDFKANIIKEHNCSDSTANKAYELLQAVIQMGGTTDCIRFKNKVNRIISKGEAYRSEWIQNDAKEVVTDPNLQMKF